MAKAFVVWDGLKEYGAALEALPETCTTEASHIIEGAANAAYVAISTVYGSHTFTGTLQKRLRLAPLNAKKYVTGFKLTSGSPLAWLFDNGTQARHTKFGVNRGRMPPTHAFSGAVGKEKRRAAQQLRDMLERQGASSVTET
jgi:hypothetical protein